MRRATFGKFVPGATIMLTTMGAKTGKRRETPLEAALDGDDYIVVGSNFAREAHPHWTANLIANPEAKILVRGRTFSASATLLEGEERAEAWRKALAHFGPWDAYRGITSREFRIFRLVVHR